MRRKGYSKSHVNKRSATLTGLPLNGKCVQFYRGNMPLMQTTACVRAASNGPRGRLTQPRTWHHNGRNLPSDSPDPLSNTCP